jgi:hypothetical protein
MHFQGGERKYSVGRDNGSNSAQPLERHVERDAESLHHVGQHHSRAARDTRRTGAATMMMTVVSEGCEVC